MNDQHVLTNIEKKKNKNLSHSPLQSFGQIRFDNIGLQRCQFRMPSNAAAKMYKFFQTDVLVLDAVGASLGGVIDKRSNRSDIVRGSVPIQGVGRNVTKEKEDMEAGVKFVHLEFNTNSPVPNTVVRTFSRQRADRGGAYGRSTQGNI